MGAGSKYSDALKVSALAHYDLNGSIRGTAKEFGIPHSTLKVWIDGRKEGGLGILDMETRIDLSKSYFIEQSKTIMDMALTVVKTKINSASAAQAATIYAILYDKVALMEGNNQGSSGNVTNNVIVNMSDDEKAAFMGKVLGRMANKDVIEVESCPVSDENNNGDISGQPDF